MFTKKVLILTLFFYSIQNALADEPDISSMSCIDIRNAALDLHVQCINTFLTCEDIRNQYELLDCNNASDSIAIADFQPLNKEICKSLTQTLSDCSFINGALIYQVAVRDLWSTYFDKRCNVIDGDTCSLNIGGVNTYDPCFLDTAVNDSTTYDCSLSNDSSNTQPTEVPSVPAPPVPLNLAPEVPTVPAPPAPIIPSREVNTNPVPPAPFNLAPEVPTVPAPPAPIIPPREVPSVPTPAKPTTPLPKIPSRPGSTVPSILVPSKRPMIAAIVPNEIYADRTPVQELVSLILIYKNIDRTV